MTKTTSTGAVAAGDRQTSAAGAALLRQGGNAVDAAVGAAFAAFVCEVALCSPLGGGVLLRYGEGEVTAVDFFARAPGLGAAPPAELDFRDVVIDFGPTKQGFHIGRGATAVPGALVGLLEVHRRWGRLPLVDVAAPAVDLARNGYVLSSALARVSRMLEPIAEWTEATRALFYGEGTVPPSAGDRLRNPDLADRLEAVARRPAVVRDIYRQLAEEFGPAAGGLVTGADVAAIETVFHRSLEVRHGDWSVFTMPAPSTGGILVALGLRLLEGLGRRQTFLSPGHVRELAWAQERVLRVRDRPLEQLVWSPSWVDTVLSEDSVRELGSAKGPLRVPPSNLLGSTTHISCLDREGGAVSLTLTNGEGCGYTLTGTGIHVNNILGEEDINPRGFHLEAPGRPLSTMMAPTLALHPGGDQVVLGSGGSNRLRNAILTTLCHLLEHGVSSRDAVAAPRLHVEASRAESSSDPRAVPSLAVEGPGLSEEALEALVADFPDRPVVFQQPSLFFGGVNLVARRAGTTEGAGDERRGGWVHRVDS